MKVYFLHAPSVNLIKIGHSADPELRFQQLRLMSPVPLEVIGMIPGGYELEQELHNKFAHLQSHGEWFHATEELKMFAWLETMISLWNEMDEKSRQSFRELIDTPVFDHSRAA